MAGIFESMKGIGELIPSAASAINTAISGIRTAITGQLPPEKQAELNIKLVEIENAMMTAQMEVNKVEAASARFWVAGARPFIIWIGGVVIAYVYIISPILVACGVNAPQIQMADLWPVLTGVLGLGGYRTFEKLKGVTK